MGSLVVEPLLPVVVIPTTAGTGAEATKNAVIACDNPPCKKSLRHPAMMPRIVVVDPGLTATLDPLRIAAGGMDAITQLIESGISCRANRWTQTLVAAALPDALDAIPIVYERTADELTLRRSRETMAWAALVSGMTLANSGLGLAHGVAASIGVHAGIPHGIACAMMLPVALRVNRAFLDEVFGAVIDCDGLESRMVQLSERLGLPSRLSQLGITADQIPMIARDSKGNSLAGNPVPIDENFLTKLLYEVL